MWPFTRKPVLHHYPMEPEGYELIEPRDTHDVNRQFLHSGDLVYDRRLGAWFEIEHKDYEKYIGGCLGGELETNALAFYRPKPPKPQEFGYRPGETPLGVHWKNQAEIDRLKKQKDLQGKIRTAWDGRETVVELEPSGSITHAHGFGRFEEMELTITELDNGTAERMLRERPIWHKRNIDWLPPETPRVLQIMYRHVFRVMPPEHKQKLYARGGVDYIRDVCLDVAKKMLEDEHGELSKTAAPIIEKALARKSAEEGHPLSEDPADPWGAAAADTDAGA